MKFGDLLYINYYYPLKDRIINRVLVIGFLRKYFKFKLFFYINSKKEFPKLAYLETYLYFYTHKEKTK